MSKSHLFRGFQIHHESGIDPSLPPLLLLHGTGGDEHSLVGLARIAAPSAPLLGMRGREMEGTITRWFLRHGEGVFDLVDLERRALELADCIEAATSHFGFAHKPIAFGYSNGGNITAGLLMRRPEVLGGAVMMRCMAGLEPKSGLALAGLPVLMLNGARDPLAPVDRQRQLAGVLAAHGASVTTRVAGPGHDLSEADGIAARAWLTALAQPSV